MASQLRARQRCRCRKEADRFEKQRHDHGTSVTIECGRITAATNAGLGTGWDARQERPSTAGGTLGDQFPPDCSMRQNSLDETLVPLVDTELYWRIEEWSFIQALRNERCNTCSFLDLV